MSHQDTNDYSKDYENQLLRGVEENKPWDQISEILKIAQSGDIVLDIGCGTATKLKAIAPSVRKVIGLEPGKKMLVRAHEHIRDWGISNIELVEGAAEQLPFEEETFDVVTCMLAIHDTREIWRVLKPGGYAVLEKIGDRDKWNLKKAFGKSETPPSHTQLKLQQRFVDGGWRGSYSHFEPGQRAQMYEEEFKKLFSEVSVRNEFWTTYYSLEGWSRLCEETPTVRNFDRVTDRQILNKIQILYGTDRGIKTEQNRILIVAQK